MSADVLVVCEDFEKNETDCIHCKTLTSKQHR